MPNDPTPVTLENRVLAIAEPDKAELAATDLRAAGFEVIELSGPDDAERLATAGEGIRGLLRKAAAAMGDELRIIDAADRALSEGKVVLIVAIGEQDPTEATGILTDNGVDSSWDFRDWTFTRTGPGDQEEGGVHG